MAEFVKDAFIGKHGGVFAQFIRYMIVGGIASLADVSVFYIASNILGIYELAANTMSFVLGLLVNYFLSRGWVFNSRKSNLKKDFLPFALIGLIGLVISNILLFILLDLGLMKAVVFLKDDIANLAAKLLTVFVVLFWNFAARKKIVFKN